MTPVKAYVIRTGAMVFALSAYGISRRIDLELGGGFFSGALRAGVFIAFIIWLWKATRIDGIRRSPDPTADGTFASASETMPPLTNISLPVEAAVTLKNHLSESVPSNGSSSPVDSTGVTGVVREVSKAPYPSSAKSMPTGGNDEMMWARALSELESENRKPGLWGKAFSLADGDEQKARAKYLGLRVEQLLAEQDELLQAQRNLQMLEERRRAEDESLRRKREREEERQRAEDESLRRKRELEAAQKDIEQAKPYRKVAHQMRKAGLTSDESKKRLMAEGLSEGAAMQLLVTFFGVSLDSSPARPQVVRVCPECRAINTELGTNCIRCEALLSK